ncbi:hypothetical protein Tco_0148166, partial [Tanacetum coccineum]
MVSNQIRPPGFPLVQNPHANSQNNFNRGNNFNQNRGNNFNQGQIYRPPVNQPVAHQGPAPQTQLNELRDQAYENSLIYKEKTKRIHDAKTKDFLGRQIEIPL